MPLILNGTTGISGTDGSAATPAVQGTDANTGMFFPAADQIAFAEGGTEVMRIDASGNVGIGTSTPSTYGNGLVVYNAATGVVRAAGGSVTGYMFASNGGSVGAAGTETNHPFALYTNNTERARITTGGDFLVGTTSAIASSTGGIHVQNGGEQIRIKNTNNANYWRFVTDNNNTVYIVNQSTTGVFMANGGSSWSGLSDERHKDIIEPITDAVEKVSTLRTVIGKFKTDDDGVRRSFLIAQDVQKVLPEAVHHADQDRLGLAYTEVIPLLTAAIKELTAKLEAAEARIATLEAR